MTTLLVPDVRRGRGTGHIRRCVRLARLIPDSCVLVSENSGAEFRGLDELADLTGGLDGRQIVGVPPETVDRVIIDHSGMASGGLEVYGGAVTIGLDLGGDARPYCSYLVDTIPRVDTVPANIRDIGLLDLPTFSEMKAGAPGRVLVSFGGEDPAMLTEPTVRVLVERLGLNPANLSVIRPGLRELSRLPGGIQPLEPVPTLASLFSEVEWVVCAFGLTAFEAASAGRNVITVAPSRYHDALARSAGFATAGILGPDAEKLERLFANPWGCGDIANQMRRLERRPLAGVLASIETSRTGCPAHPRKRGAAVWRGEEKTYFRCPNCATVYMERFRADEETYDPSYFDAEYRAQYGKTYLEDFPSIEGVGRRRVAQIRSLAPETASVLDIGCAYGPFLRAAAESGLEVAGVDVSEAAVNYVRSELGLDAVVDSALTLDCEAAFGRTRFDAVALWYVIEHFPDLSPLLTRLADWVRPGGILAIATPCLDGVSGRRNADIFFERSPRDHFSIWSRRSARRLLGEFGFRVVKLVSTGHHPERYPSVRRGCLPRSLAMAHSRVMGWGDTFEIYARRSDSG